MSMFRDESRARSASKGCLLIVALFATGCHPDSLIRSVQTAPAGSEMEAEPEAKLVLDQLLVMAEVNHPDLAVARQRAEAARGRLIQAGLYPNPVLQWEADEMNSKPKTAGTQGPVLTQTIVTCGKLRYAQRAAAAGVEASDWQAMTRWYDVATRVRFAYYEVLTALGEMQVSREVVQLTKDAEDAAKKLKLSGAGTLPDVLRAEVEVEQSQVRLSNAEQRARAAWKLLAVAVGVPELTHQPIDNSLEAAAPEYTWETVVRTVLTRSSELQEAEAIVAQAEQLVMRAEAEKVPDFQLLVRPFYSYVDNRTELKVQAGMALPIFNRNQGNIASARADLARAHEEVRQVELRLTERLTLAFQRYRQSQQQATVYRTKVIKKAVDSLELVKKGYASGDPKYDFTAVLQAQQTLAQARLAQVQALGNLWRAVAEIAGLLQGNGPGSAEEAVPNESVAPQQDCTIRIGKPKTVN
jgi:cobalt-zinc-cadmium efflux system outer membrane protein